MEELLSKCHEIGVTFDRKFKEVYIPYGQKSVPVCVAELVKDHKFKLSFKMFS